MSAKVYNASQLAEGTSEKSAALRNSQDGDAVSVCSSNSIRQMSHEDSLCSGYSNASADDRPTDEGVYLGTEHFMPASELGESILLAPDITMFCQKCQRYINISDLKEHGSYHEALRTFQYRDLEQPANLGALTVRRKTLIKEIFRQLGSCKESLDPAWLRKLDDAYEIIRAELESNARRVYGVNSPKVHGISLKCESMTCIKAIGSCCSLNERWKNVMDEEKTFQNCFGGDPTKCFLGIYSGYNGPNAAETSARELHKFLQSEIEKFDKCFYSATTIDGLVENRGVGQDFSHTERTRNIHVITSPHPIHSSMSSVAPKVNSEAFKTTSDEAKFMKTSAQEDGTNLPHNKYKNDSVTYAHNISDAFVTAHRSVDEILSSGKGETSRVRWSGCSTLTCIIQSHENNAVRDEELPKTECDAVKEIKGEQEAPNGDRGSLKENVDTSPHHQLESQQKPSHQRKHLATIHLANAGDVRAVLIRRNKPTCLTAIHTPANTKEHQRVTKLGGTVNHSHKDFRLNGVLATTRGLGNHGDQMLKKCVINRPFTASIPVDEFCQFLILASNGVWQVLSEEEAAVLLLEMLPCHFIQPPSVLSITVDDLLKGGTKKNRDSCMDDSEEDNSTSFCSLEFKPNSSSEDPGKRADMHLLDTDSECLSERDSVIGSDAVVRRNNTSDKMSTACKGRINEKSDKCNAKEKTHDSFSQVLENFTENASNISSSLDKPGSNTDTNPMTILSKTSTQTEDIVAVEDATLHLSRLMAERLVQAALMAGTKDNVTVIIVLFNQATDLP